MVFVIFQLATYPNRDLSFRPMRRLGVVRLSQRYSLSQRKITNSLNEKIRQWRHIGIYAYTLKALKIFSKHPRTKLEIEASLEQLRAFDLKMKIIIEEAQISPGPDVDTEQDLSTVRRIFGAN